MQKKIIKRPKQLFMASLDEFFSNYHITLRYHIIYFLVHLTQILTPDETMG